MGPFDFKPPEIKLENTILGDMTKEIKASQRETDRKIDQLREDNAKSGREAFRVAVAALIVSSLTLLATILFGILR